MNIVERAEDSFGRLTECALVKKKEVTPDTLAEFQSLLNRAQPRGNNAGAEYGIWIEARNTYDRVGKIYLERMPERVLFLSEDTICAYFGIKNLVTLQRNSRYGPFTVVSHEGVTARKRVRSTNRRGARGRKTLRAEQPRADRILQKCKIATTTLPGIDDVEPAEDTKITRQQSWGSLASPLSSPRNSEKNPDTLEN